MNTMEQLIQDMEKIDSEIYTINASIADKVKELTSQKSTIKKQLDDLIQTHAEGELFDKDYGCGTVNIDLPLYKVKVVVKKNVKWDENILRNIANQIREGGQNPEDYIKFKLSVAENDYKKFGDNIQKVFEAARTVEPSKPTIEIIRK